MNLNYLYLKDSELVVLAMDKETKRDATKEIQRRKAVGSWRLIASWTPDKEEAVAEERVYALGVKGRA
tara:strand:+ start:732 stop:935 length:204 start_codon:yes stop_codon:yes gene_type:complete